MYDERDFPEHEPLMKKTMGSDYGKFFPEEPTVQELADQHYKAEQEKAAKQFNDIWR